MHQAASAHRCRSRQGSFGGGGGVEGTRSTELLVAGVLLEAAGGLGLDELAAIRGLPRSAAATSAAEKVAITHVDPVLVVELTQRAGS